MLKNEKLDVKYYILIFIETFSIWQMGVIFYSSKTLTINSLISTPVDLGNSILFILIGYILGIIAIYLFPNKSVFLGRITTIISLLASVILFFDIPANLFTILYCILTFNCVFFISIDMSLIINYYSLNSAIINGILGAIVSSLFIALCQNSIFPLSFNIFNIVGVICISLMTFGLFKLPLKFEIKFVLPKSKAQLPSKKVIFGLVLIQLISCLNTLFTSSIAESIKGGVSISYLGAFISGIVFLLLYKKFKLSPFKSVTYYLGISAIGFLLYLLPIGNLPYVSLFLQGANFLIIMIIPFLISLSFENYQLKLVAPITVLIAFLTVIINSTLIELLRNTPSLLYSTYAVISIFGVIVYLIMKPNLELQYDKNEKNIFPELTNREREVIELIIKGQSVKEIASTLFLSEHTIKEYNKKIFKKYDVHSKVELIAKINRKI